MAFELDDSFLEKFPKQERNSPHLDSEWMRQRDRALFCQGAKVVGTLLSYTERTMSFTVYDDKLSEQSAKCQLLITPHTSMYEREYPAFEERLPSPKNFS